jgi:MarR family transcriptional regulator, organic hydroperoxide resistance regulator
VTARSSSTSTTTRRPAEADLDRVVGVFDAFMHRLMAEHAPELNAIDLTMSQTKAMYLVLAAGQLRMSELAARLGITSSTATGVVDALVGQGLLVRHEEPADRRQVVVTATAEAEVTLERFRELNSRRMREMLSHVAAEELEVIERALHVLDAAIAADHATIDPQGESQS